jgi:cellulose synthase/poly-beta-1,6-N-acetylglucosamine synthase-like glycosyltransferase
LSHVYWRTAAGVLEEFCPHIFRASAASEVAADCIDPEISINIYQPSRRHVPRDLHLHQHSCKTLKSLIMNHKYFSSLRFRFILHQLCFPAIFILAFSSIMLLHIIIIIIIHPLFHFLLRLQIHRQICFCIFLLLHFTLSVSAVLSIMSPIKCNNGINQKLPVWS